MLSSGLAGMALGGCGGRPVPQRKPNFVIIFCDDQGYADVGCFGARGFETPNLDRMAEQGIRFTDFHASTAVCSASRASLLTGCYPERVGILGALFPQSETGLSSDELTIAEMLKEQGYATAAFGKWHLGDAPPFLPTRHGFDEYFGLPYSNDMWPHHPTIGDQFGPLPLIEGEQVVKYLDDQSQLTTWYTERAVGFIEASRDRPFFLYLAHNMPHVPLFVSEKFRGKSARGLFGDVIMEIDWSVGQVLKTLGELGLDENTLVIFTSDNGPWLSYGDHAGSAGDLREGKGTMFEGGMREPCIMRWPGRIPAGAVSSELATTMDLLPTLAGLAGGRLHGHKIDGHDILPLIEARPGARTPTDVYYCYYAGELRAVRSGRWKLHFPHAYRTMAGRPGGTGGLPEPYSSAEIGLELFDLQSDVGETTDVADRHPEVVARLQGLAELAREDLGDKLTERVGKGVRPPGKYEWDKPKKAEEADQQERPDW
ncbi:MAG: sulfatase [Candidatus Glassbacteria bacterium]|nr:sulfatase [Candidatus Glassbacteria bacterium]